MHRIGIHVWRKDRNISKLRLAMIFFSHEPILKSSPLHRATSFCIIYHNCSEIKNKRGRCSFTKYLHFFRNNYIPGILRGFFRFSQVQMPGCKFLKRGSNFVIFYLYRNETIDQNSHFCVMCASSVVHGQLHNLFIQQNLKIIDQNYISK